MKLPKWVEEAASKSHDSIDDKCALKWEYVEAFKAGAALVLERLEKTRETKDCVGTIACHDDSYHAGRESVRKEVRGE